MKRLILIGASGSIGSQTLDVIRQHSDELQLVGVAVGYNIESLTEILKEFPVSYAYSIERNEQLEQQFTAVRFFYGEDGLLEIVRLPDYDMLVNTLVGFTGFLPTLEAIKNHKDVALANKEALVAGGNLINAALKEYGTKLYPIDSEHVAIWQCLQGHPKKDVRRLILTASGGSFRNLKREELADVTLEQALNHPVWNMGSKITIDSATMMNKGFEIIEAHFLFDIPYEKIDVIIHPESTVHSMVEYEDGSIIAQMGVPDMRLMIKYALLYPEHLPDRQTNYLDLGKVGELHFRDIDYHRYPLVKLAKQVGAFEGNFGAILNGANDEAVSLFLNRKIRFIDIETCIFKTLQNAHFIKEPTIPQITESYDWARENVDQLIRNKLI